MFHSSRLSERFWALKRLRLDLLCSALLFAGKVTNPIHLRIGDMEVAQHDPMGTAWEVELNKCTSTQMVVSMSSA